MMRVQYASKPANWFPKFETKKCIDAVTGESLFYVQAHCWCGSTMGSGDWWPTEKQARDVARENIMQHVENGPHAVMVMPKRPGGQGDL